MFFDFAEIWRSLIMSQPIRDERSRSKGQRSRWPRGQGHSISSVENTMRQQCTGWQTVNLVWTSQWKRRMTERHVGRPQVAMHHNSHILYFADQSLECEWNGTKSYCTACISPYFGNCVIFELSRWCVWQPHLCAAVGIINSKFSLTWSHRTVNT